MERSRTRILLVVVSCVLALFVGAYVFRDYLPRLDTREGETFDTGYNLTLTDYDGNEVELSDYRRNVLLVYAWASWCPYCGAELESLARLKETYGDSVKIVAVNRAESRQDAKAFTDALTLHDGVTLLLDSTDALYKDIQGYAMPEMLFIDKRGQVRFHQRGPINEDAIRKAIDTILPK